MKEYKISNDEKLVVNNITIDDEIEKLRQFLYLKEQVFTICGTLASISIIISLILCTSVNVYYIMGIFVGIAFSVVVNYLVLKLIQCNKACFNCCFNLFSEAAKDSKDQVKKIPPLYGKDVYGIDIDSYYKNSPCCNSFEYLKSTALRNYLFKQKNISVTKRYSKDRNGYSILYCAMYALINNVKYFTGDLDLILSWVTPIASLRSHDVLKSDFSTNVNYIMEHNKADVFQLCMPEKSGMLNPIDYKRTRYYSCHSINFTAIVNNLDLTVFNFKSRLVELNNKFTFGKIIITISRDKFEDDFDYIDRGLKVLEEEEFAKTVENFDLKFVYLKFQRVSEPEISIIPNRMFIINTDSTRESIYKNIREMFPL